MGKIEFQENKIKKVIILKNDRGGDLMNSLKSICSIIKRENNVTMFCKIPTLALFSYDIKNEIDYNHQKISFYEWYGNKSMDFAFLNNDFSKSIRKISTRI